MIRKNIEELGMILLSNNFTCSCAESCTGGLISASLTEISGSSAWFNGAIVSYSNDAKINVLGVSEQTIIDHGAVSAQTVFEMASFACKKLNTNLGIAVSGIAGPTGGTDAKPVGTVYIGICLNGLTKTYHYIFEGDRQNVRLMTLKTSIELALKTLKDS